MRASTLERSSQVAHVSWHSEGIDGDHVVAYVVDAH